MFDARACMTRPSRCQQHWTRHVPISPATAAPRQKMKSPEVRHRGRVHNTRYLLLTRTPPHYTLTWRASRSRRRSRRFCAPRSCARRESPSTTYDCSLCPALGFRVVCCDCCVGEMVVPACVCRRTSRATPFHLPPRRPTRAPRPAPRPARARARGSLYGVPAAAAADEHVARQAVASPQICRSLHGSQAAANGRR